MRLAKELQQYPPPPPPTPPPPATQSPAPQTSPAYTPQLQIGASVIDLQARTVKETIQSNASHKHFTDPTGLQLTAHVTLWFSRMCWGTSPVRHGICLLLKSHVRLNAPKHRCWLSNWQLTCTWMMSSYWIVGQGFNEQRWLVPTDSFDISWLKSDVCVVCKAVLLVHIADWLLFVQAACENGWQSQKLQTAHWTPWRTNFELFISAKDKSETHWLSPSWRPFFPEVLESSSRHASVRKLSQWSYSLLMHSMLEIFTRFNGHFCGFRNSCWRFLGKTSGGQERAGIFLF